MMETPMHSYVTPQSVKDRVLRRQGKVLSHDTIDAGRTALVVVDMQNYFVAEGFAAEVPEARDIVPNINRMAGAPRGGRHRGVDPDHGGWRAGALGQSPQAHA